MPPESKKKGKALAIDLGSTRFKLGEVDSAGHLGRVFAVPAPPMAGAGLIREVAAESFLAHVDRLWREYPRAAAGLPLGLVCQRSTFVVWDRDTGRALTPVVSWQDRRAVEWCERHRAADDLLRRRAGLLMSPHYAGPKLAAILGAEPALRDRMRAGDALFGNLDAWLAWQWSTGAAHRTDLTMAARTAMVDIAAGEWSDELLELYGVPAAALPDIIATDGPSLPLRDGLRLTASIADQASSALTVLDPQADAALVNLGTGGFVLRPVADATERLAGYLTGPILSSPRHGQRVVLEGTINGAGPAVDAFHPGPTTLPKDDPCPDGFAIPDMDGIGAPHWRPRFGLTLSAAALGLSNPADKRRVVVEGLLFRVFEILTDIGYGRLPETVYLSGGLSRAPSVACGLAALVGGPVHVLDEPESTLLGAARLALGIEPFAAAAAERVEPSDAGAYLPEKFPRWAAWLRGLLDAAD